MSEIKSYKIWYENMIALRPLEPVGQLDGFHRVVLYSDHERVARRVEELGQAVGLLTTLHPTMVMDADHPLDMAKKIEVYVARRVEALEKVVEVLREVQEWRLSAVGLSPAPNTDPSTLGERIHSALAALDAQGERETR